jgi:hypothetical protein
VTTAEDSRFTADADVLGERVAWWLGREAQGFSALDEAIYWAHVDKGSALKREPAWSPFDRGAA